MHCFLIAFSSLEIIIKHCGQHGYKYLDISIPELFSEMHSHDEICHAHERNEKVKHIRSCPV